MTRAQAHANIALMKYWGKKDERLALPYTSSLSLTLDALYTITEVRRDAGLAADEFILNGERQGEAETAKISKFVDLFRQEDDSRVRIDTRNFFPTASGLASSASGFAALATALNAEFGLYLNKRELSRVARRGSGSASRSLFGGLAVWQTGDDETSFAYPIEADLDIEMIIVVISGEKKSRSSRSLMKQTVDESAFYLPWVEDSHREFPRMIEAVKAGDLELVGRIAERNAMMMHGTLLAINEPFTYLQPDSLRVIEAVQEMRREGLAAWYTMDAGPNVKIITDSGSRESILQQLREKFSELQIIASQAGPEARVL